MTGAGAQTLAFVEGDGFGSIPSSPTYHSPGLSPTVETLSLDNLLQRLRRPLNVEAVESIAGNFEGAFVVSYAMNGDTHTNVRNIVFSDNGDGFVSKIAPTSRWYIGTDYLDDTDNPNTVERVLKKCIPLEYQIDYSQERSVVRETLTMAYGDEEKNSSITPSSINNATKNATVPFHGVDLSFPFGSVTNRLQSVRLTFSGPISRYHYGADRHPAGAVIAAPETSLDVVPILEREDFVQAAYGSSSASTPQDDIDSERIGLTFSNANGVVATYDLESATPRGYDWSDLINADADLTEPARYDVTGQVLITERDFSRILVIPADGSHTVGSNTTERYRSIEWGVDGDLIVESSGEIELTPTTN